MSLSNNKNFEIEAFDARSRKLDHTTLVKVYDGHGRYKGEALGTVSLMLSKGLYTVRLERFGEMREQVVIHDKRTREKLDIPRRHSAMPMSDTVHTHEFLQEAATRYSKVSTFKQPGAQRHWPRLMIMIRSDGGDPSDRINIQDNLVLYDENGYVITRFEIEKTQPNDPKTFLVFSAKLVVGNYILTLMGNSEMQLFPITIYDNWDSFIFVPYNERPNFAASSIKLAKRGSGYKADDKLTTQVDAAIQGLGSRLDLLPERQRMEALYGKFQHPLLGLIGAHSHFLGLDRRQRLEDQVLRNLWRLLPNSADVIALLLMSLSRDGRQLPKNLRQLDNEAKIAFGERIAHLFPLSFPPLLNTGLIAIVQASQELDGLIKRDSWLDAAANSSFGAGVWSIWEQRMMDGQRYRMAAQATEAPYIHANLPSTQQIYPAIKRALANASTRSVREISAATYLDDVISPNPEVMKELMIDLDQAVAGYSWQVPSSDLSGLKTVRDLANRVRDRARPRSLETLESVESDDKFRPSSEIEDWLVDAVHDQIEKSGESFDAGETAKRYSVTKNSVKRAAKLDRPTNYS